MRLCNICMYKTHNKIKYFYFYAKFIVKLSSFYLHRLRFFRWDVNELLRNDDLANHILLEEINTIL